MRDVAAASTVLLTNVGDVLPLNLLDLHTASVSAMQQISTIAVVGPFADCGDCYLHSYNGQPSYVVSLL